MYDRNIDSQVSPDCVKGSKLFREGFQLILDEIHYPGNWYTLEIPFIIRAPGRVWRQVVVTPRYSASAIRRE